MGDSLKRLKSCLGGAIPTIMDKDYFKEALNGLEKIANENPEVDMHFVITGRERASVNTHVNFSHSTIDKYEDNSKSYNNSIVVKECGVLERLCKENEWLRSIIEDKIKDTTSG